MQYSIEGLGSEMLMQFKLCDGGCAMMWYARYKREVLDVQCSMSCPTSKSAPYSMPSAVTIGFWTAFVRQRKWFARHLRTLCQRVTWQNDKRRPKTFQTCIAFKVAGHMNNSTSTFDNLASTQSIRAMNVRCSISPGRGEAGEVLQQQTRLYKLCRP